MSFRFPQSVGVVSGVTSGGFEQLPIQVVDSGDGLTGQLVVAGISATVGFPFSTTLDAQVPAGASGVGLLAFNGTTLDRIRVSAVGAATAGGTPGALLVQGALNGGALPISGTLPYATDGATSALTNTNFGVAGLNPAGAYDRLRVAALGQDLAPGTVGVLVIQGSSLGEPIPVTGSFVTAFPFSAIADNQAPISAAATAIVAYDGANFDRVIARNLGTDAVATTPGTLVVQSSPAASPFPIAAIGQGALFQVPAGNSNGALISAQPARAQGVRIYVPPNCNFIYTIAASQPSSPADVVTFFNPSTAQFPVVIDENLNGMNLYVLSPIIANTGLKARWV